MRLTCPSCGAAYDLPDDRLPAGGSHVQCTACHTRWFARARAADEAPPSEDEIIARLETRAALAAGPLGVERGSEPIAFPRAARAGPPRAEAEAAPQAPSEPETPVAEPSADTTDVATDVQSTAEPWAAATQVRSAAGPTPEAAASGGPQTPLRPRHGAERPVAVARAPAAPARPRRGWLGFALALALAGGALGAYLRADDLARRAPAAAPALAAYAEGVEAGRTWIEARLGPLRER